MAAVLPQTAGSLLASRQRSAAGCVQPRRPQAAARGLAARRQCRAAPVFAAASGIEADAAEELQEIEEEFEDEDDGVGLTTQQVESFLQTLCEDTEIVDLELKMGSFSMKVRRSLTGGAGGDSNGGGATAASPLPSPVATQSLDMAQFQPLSPAATQSMSFDEEDDSESLVMIESPKVGVLRRGKYFKGKKVGKDNLVEEGDKVKKGQHIGYVEQLGTFVPIEAPQAGEIVGFVVDDGKPVEYGETVVELAPFFGGHIIGDLKYA